MILLLFDTWCGGLAYAIPGSSSRAHPNIIQKKFLHNDASLTREHFNSINAEVSAQITLLRHCTDVILSRFEVNRQPHECSSRFPVDVGHVFLEDGVVISWRGCLDTAKGEHFADTLIEWQVENMLQRASRSGQFETLVYHSAIDPQKVIRQRRVRWSCSVP